MFYYEKYKIGNADAIRSRFSFNRENPLSDKLIVGIKKYLDFLSERQVSYGTFGNQTDYSSHSAFGSLMSAGLSKSFKQVRGYMDGRLQSRYLGAYIDIDDTVTCDSIIKLAVPANQTKVDNICQKMPIDNTDALLVYYRAATDDGAKANLKNVTELTDDEVTALYDTSVEKSLGNLIQTTETKLS